MLKDKEQLLKNKLKGILKEVGHDKQIKQDVMDEFKSRNLDSFRSALVFQGNLDLDTLTDEESDIQFLYIFSLALDKTLKEKEITILNDYQNHFTKIEVEQWENYRVDAQDEIYPIVFKNVIEISPGYWQSTITSQELERLNNANVLIYNPNSQRGFKVSKKSIGIDINPAKVKEIADRMLAGEQFADDIKLNILKTGEEKISFNSKAKTLTVFEGSVINTFDGQHRLSGTALAMSINPELEFVWPLKITNFTEIKTHDFMVQINKQSPIKLDVIRTKDYSKPENLVLDKIMDSKGDLANVTKDTDAFVKSDRALTTKSIIAEAIKDNYNNLDSAMQRNEVADWIVEFTNYLMGVYSEEFIVNPYDIKKTSYINNLNMFYGYIALSAQLKNNKKWKDALKQKITSIDFNVENPMWREIGIIKDNKINKTTKNKVYTLFNERV